MEEEEEDERENERPPPPPPAAAPEEGEENLLREREKGESDAFFPFDSGEEAWWEKAWPKR